MEIPESFKTRINSTFYTTPIQITAIATIVDTEGGETKGPGETLATMNGNVQPVGAELQQTLLGQGIEAELKITAPAEIPAETGNLLIIKSETYEITNAKVYDSHAEILARRWKQP